MRMIIAPLACGLVVAGCSSTPLATTPEVKDADPQQATCAAAKDPLKMGGRGDTVTVKPFQLDLTEVTADAYAACVRAGRCTADGLKCGDKATYGVSGKGNHPINCVDWNQATAYCQWAGKRLPTEEEWEWAARGQERGWEYPWGNDKPAGQLCWDGEGNDLGKGNRESTCPVGSYPRGDAPGGIHDLAGNVWEWTASNYDANARVDRGGAGASTTPPSCARRIAAGTRPRSATSGGASAAPDNSLSRRRAAPRSSRRA